VQKAKFVKKTLGYTPETREWIREGEQFM
jgi:hypothetical protein